VPNNKLSKRECLGKIRSVVQYVVMSQTNLTVLVYVMKLYSLSTQFICVS